MAGKLAPDDEVLGWLDELIRRLDAAGLTGPAEQARQAARLARTDPAAASDMLAEVAAAVGAHSPEACRSD